MNEIFNLGNIAHIQNLMDFKFINSNILDYESSKLSKMNK